MSVFAGLVEQVAASRPAAISHVFLDWRGREVATLDWAGFAARVRAVAAALSDQGLAGRRVVLVCPSGQEFAITLWGCLYAGAVPVPAPADTFTHAVGRAHAIVETARPAAIVCTAATAELVARIAGDVPVLDAAALLTGGAVRSGDRASAPWALLQFTSGSTARPRGVCLTADNVIANGRAIIDAYGLTPDEVGVSWLPMHHDMGLIGALIVPVMLGCRTVILPSLSFLQRPERWLQAIDRYRGTLSGAPNFAYEYCLRRLQAVSVDGLDLSCWRFAIDSAEPVDAVTLDSFAGRLGDVGFARSALRPSYGLAEATLLVSAGGGAAGPHTIDAIVEPPPAGDRAAGRYLVGCGSAVGGVELAIVDGEAAVAPGSVGEIVMRGASVAAGYFDPATGEAVPLPTITLADRPGAAWFRTADLGLLNGGELYVVGRADDLMQVRGRNVHASEVEAVACRAHALVTPGGCAAVGRREGGTCALVVLAEVPRAEVSSRAVPAAIREALAHAIDVVPSDVVLVPVGALPRTTSGKIRRRRCLEQYEAGVWPSPTTAPPPAPVTAGRQEPAA
jgi:acyl-CoA synthetase (AMP-forming)/AMP-acid ligase II